MRKLLFLFLFLLVCALSLGACVDIDEALPHYSTFGTHGAK